MFRWHALRSSISIRWVLECGQRTSFPHTHTQTHTLSLSLSIQFYTLSHNSNTLSDGNGAHCNIAANLFRLFVLWSIVLGLSKIDKLNCELWHRYNSFNANGLNTNTLTLMLKNQNDSVFICGLMYFLSLSLSGAALDINLSIHIKHVLCQIKFI